MKILFVSAVLPYPLHSGGQIRIYNLLKRLSYKHEIHLYAFIRSEKEKEYLQELAFCECVTTVLRGRVWQPKYFYKTLTNSYPLLWNSYHNSQMQSFLADEIAKGAYDLVHIEPGYVWPSVPTEHRVPIVVAEHNIEHEIYEKYVSAFPVSFLKPFLSLDVSKMIVWEKRCWESASAVVVVSEMDKKKVGKAEVVPNGVDVSSFAFRPKKKLGKNLKFLYMGDFRWMENKDAAQRVIRDWWPEIQKNYPQATLRIVGSHAPKGKYFVGRVKNIQDELYGADIMLAPIRIGGGTKYKILEAMASGLPVITSKIGIEGLDPHAVLVAETPEETVQSVHMLENSSKRLQLVTRARNLIKKDYSWDRIAQELDHVWNSLS